jgi:hypothetical protein
MLEIEYEFREVDLIHFNERQFSRNQEIQDNIKKNRWIVPAVMFLLGGFYYFYYQDRNSAAYIILLAMLWGIFSPKVIKMDLRRQILNNYSAKEKSAMFGGYKLTIDPSQAQHLIEQSPSGKNKMAWGDLVRVEQTKEYIYIYITLNTALVIPLETIKSGDARAFATQVEKMIERLS